MRQQDTRPEITAPGQAERAQRDGEARFQALVQALHSAVALVDERGAFVLVNQAFRRMFEIPEDADILNVNSRDWAQWRVFDEHGVLLPVDEHPVRKAALTGRAVRNQLVAVRSPTARDPLWLLISADPVLDERGLVERLVCTYYDITERKAAEEAVRQSEQRLRLFIDHAPAAVAMFDRDMRYLAASRRYLRDYGLDEGADLTGRSHYEVFPEIPERWKEIHRRCLKGAVEQAHEDSFPRGDGRVDWVRWEIHPWTDALGEVGGLVLFTEVITDRKLAQLALEESDRRKTEFLAVLSHELRNPLAPIRNSTHLLERAPAGSEQARRAREVIGRQVEHLTRLVDDLLDVTRISRGKVDLQIQRVDLRDVIRRSVEDARTLYERAQVELVFELGPAPVWIDADPTRIAQVIGNILHNGQKFTPAGGAVTVRLETEGGAVHVRIRDTGAGMEPGREASMFAQFAQGEQGLARSKGGLGLGLSLAQSLVELHGGTVAAHSEGLGRGTEFTVSLPLAPGAGSHPRAGEPARGTRRTSSSSRTTRTPPRPWPRSWRSTPPRAHREERPLGAGAGARRAARGDPLRHRAARRRRLRGGEAGAGGARPGRRPPHRADRLRPARGPRACQGGRLRRPRREAARSGGPGELVERRDVRARDPRRPPRQLRDVPEPQVLAAGVDALAPNRGSRLADGLGQRQEPPRRLDVQRLHQPAFHHHHAQAPRLRLRVRRHHAARLVHLLRGGPEGGVGGGDGPRVDERLAVEAEVAPLAAGGLEARLVGEVEVHPVERGRGPWARAASTMRPRLTSTSARPGAGRARRSFVEVRRARHETRHPGRGGGHRGGGEDAAGRLDHAPERQRGRRASGVEEPGCLQHLLRPLHLGEQHRVHRRPGGQLPDPRAPRAWRGRSPAGRARAGRSRPPRAPPRPGPAPAPWRPAPPRPPGRG